MKRKIVLIGGGAHAICVSDLLSRESRYDIVGYVDRAKTDLSYTFLGNDETFLKSKNYSRKNVMLAMGVGSEISLRQKLFNLYFDKGFKFLTYTHPSAVLSKTVKVGEGTVIFPRVVLGPSVKLGDNTLLHDGVIIEHHTEIGAHSYLSPGVVIAGKCQIGEASFIGVHASVIHEIKIGANTTIGAGAVIVKSFEEENQTLVGVPANALVKK